MAISVGSLSHRLYNITTVMKCLVKRWFGGAEGWQGDGSDPRIVDVRGEVLGTNWEAQTFPDPCYVGDLESDFEAGVSCSELARRHGIHKMTVVRRLRRAGVETKRRPLASSNELVSRVRELGEQGLSERRIANAVGVSRSSVHRLLVSFRR